MVFTIVLSFFSIAVLIFFVFLLFCLSIYFANSFRFVKLIDRIFYAYTSLIGLKTDWKNSFLEQMAESSRHFFHSPFISFMLVNNDKAKVIITSADAYFGLLLDQINKKEFLVNIYRKFNFLPIVPSERGIFRDIHARKALGLKHSFSIPILTENNKLEALINIYFDYKLSLLFAMLYYILFNKRINYFYAGLLRNIYTDKQGLEELLLEQIDGYALVSLDNKTEIVSWNRGAEKLFGYRSVEIVGQKFSVLFHPSDTDTFDRCLEILKIKEEVKFFSSLRDRMTITIKVELAVKKLKQENGTTVGYSVFIKDITKEEIFKQNIQQYSFINYTILENSQDGILILNETDKIIFYNQRVRAILDNPMNLFGVPGRKIFPRHFSEEFDKAVLSLKKSDTEFIDVDYMFEQCYYNIRFFRVHKNAANDYGGVIVFFIDETIKMNTMMELEEKKEALEKINRNLLDALSSARVMQENLIPKSLSQKDGLYCAAIYELSDDIGGDFYYIDYFTSNGKKYAAAFVSDVSGHGIAASMMNVMVKDVYITLREEMEHGISMPNPDTFLQTLNKRLFDLNFFENKFITCFFSIINFTDKEISMASAGHPLPYSICGDKVELLKFKRSVPLGVLEDLPQNLVYKTSFKEGDRFVFYTDGFLDIFETQDKTPSEAVEEFFNDNIKASINDWASLIFKRNENYRKEHKLSSDDLTLLFLEFSKEKQ